MKNEIKRSWEEIKDIPMNQLTATERNWFKSLLEGKKGKVELK
jgi:hypothetical protein